MTQNTESLKIIHSFVAEPIVGQMMYLKAIFLGCDATPLARVLINLEPLSSFAPPFRTLDILPVIHESNPCGSGAILAWSGMVDWTAHTE